MNKFFGMISYLVVEDRYPRVLGLFHVIRGPRRPPDSKMFGYARCATIVGPERWTEHCLYVSVGTFLVTMKYRPAQYARLDIESA